MQVLPYGEGWDAQTVLTMFVPILEWENPLAALDRGLDTSRRIKQLPLDATLWRSTTKQRCAAGQWHVMNGNPQ